MSFAWLARWDTLTLDEQRTVLKAVAIRSHPDDPEGIGFEMSIKRSASQRAVNAAMSILRDLEGPTAPAIGAVKVYLLHRDGLSYEKIADDPRVSRYLTRSRRSTMESRRKIAFEAVRAVKKYERAAENVGMFRWMLNIARNGLNRR
jgi:hypothetical protein